MEEFILSAYRVNGWSQEQITAVTDAVGRDPDEIHDTVWPHLLQRCLEWDCVSEEAAIAIEAAINAHDATIETTVSQL